MMHHFKILLTALLSIWTIHLCQAQRNVLVIIADDLGTDYLGFYKDHKDTVEVPNLRKLVSRGVLFQNAASNPVCSSTRSGILTGRYSFRTGVGGIVGGAGGSMPLDTAENTIPRILKILNPEIATANIGKWHLQQAMPVSNLKFPNIMGYDHFEGPFIGQLSSFTNWTKYINGVATNVTNYATSENVNNAVAWLKNQNKKPFFLWLAFNAPHEPLHLPPADLHHYKNLSGTVQDIRANPKSYFKAMIQALDHEIGRLFDSLQVMGKLDNTDIIFIGDNGNTQKTDQSTDTARAKGTVYQNGIHVPFMIAGPSVKNPGQITDALVNTTDIFASVFELFGFTNWSSLIDPKKPVDSKSILPFIREESNQIRPWSFSEIFKLTPDASEAKSIRNPDFKLIKFNSGKEEFYNLKTDPEEKVNLLESNMTTEEITQYYYLCNEMENLLGVGNICLTTVDSKDHAGSYSTSIVYPNPFNSKIKIKQFSNSTIAELYNIMGERIYAGSQIENMDFSYLPSGTYVLKILVKLVQIVRITKE